MAYQPQIAAGQSGQIASTNALHVSHNAGWASDGPEIINVQSPPSWVTATGAVGDGATDDTDAIQACFDYVNGSRARNHIIYFPFYRATSATTAIYEVSAPLRVWTHTRIKGAGATIRASTGFNWTTHPYVAHANYKPVGDATPGNIALMELWNDGTTRGGTSRVHIDWLTLDCRSAAGSIGFWGKQQQNSKIIDLRIDNAETGFITWGQQGKMERLQIGGTGVNVGVYLGADFAGDGAFGTLTAKFFKFEELNVEYYTVAAVRMVCDGPNWFEDSHFENLHASPPATARVVDCQSGEFTMEKTWSTHTPDTAPVIVVGDMTPAPGLIKANYVIRQWRNANAAPNQIFMDDRVRNKTRYVGYARNVEYLSGAFQGDTHIDYDAFATWWGDEGGEVRIGGAKGGTNVAGHTGAQLTVRPNVAQDEPSVRFTDTSGVLVAGVTQNGNLFAGSFSDGTRGAITSGLVAGSNIWNTSDNAPNWWSGTEWVNAVGTPT